MKLADHAENIRQLIDKAFRNRLGRMGLTASAVQPISSIPAEYRSDRTRIESIREVLIAETGNTKDAYEKLVEELSFTLFNRIAALKVMEAHTLHPEIITRRSQHGDRSFAHRHWLEQNPTGRNEEQEGLLRFIADQLAGLSGDIPLFNLQHPYHLLPTAIELNVIINAFNQVDTDTQVETDIWKSDDVLGWLYESYNNAKKTAHKESGDKTEYNKVSIQSQVYTPRWVVKFLVDNSLGKLYLEMFPESEIKNKYKIANAPVLRTRDIKPLTEIRLIDPATGSGNFLLYAFDLFYDLYQDQIDNYSADYDENKISELIIKHNLHGVDLDDRAVQLAQFGLFIKAKRNKRTSKIEYFNVVSSDFFIPDYESVKGLFEEKGKKLSLELEKIVIDLWADLQQAYKFGSLIRLEEKFTAHLKILEDKIEQPQVNLFEKAERRKYSKFRKSFFGSLQKAIAQNTESKGLTFLNSKTHDAITFLQILTQKYDVAVANPPYTDGGDFGPELKKFIEENYKKPYKFNSNLYAAFIKRCYELIDEKGKMALIHPLTFMYISIFEDVRNFILEKLHIDQFIEFGLGGIFTSKVDVDVAGYIFEKENKENTISFFMNLQQYKGLKIKRIIFETAILDYLNGISNKHNYTLDQSKLKIIEGWPFIYWISDGFREKFKEKTLDALAANVSVGIQMPGENLKYLRFHWEINDFEYKSYLKGGDYNKWYGNNWLKVKSVVFNNISGQEKIRQGLQAVTSGRQSSKGASFRYKSNESYVDNGTMNAFFKSKKATYYTLGFLNSTLVSYLLDCFNPTVNKQAGDLKRIPIVKPDKQQEKIVVILSLQNIKIKKTLCSFNIIETNFEKNPLVAFSEPTLRERLLSFLFYENAQLAQVLLNEAIINEIIFEVYELRLEDRLQVETKMGKPIGELPVLVEARDAYLSSAAIENETVNNFINELEVATFDGARIREIKEEFSTLYQSNNDLEEFCIRHQINPINIWYWFKDEKVLPQARAAKIALEFIADSIRIILANDDDGIIPLVGQLGEQRLLDRLEKHCIDNGFSPAQFLQLDGLLCRPLNEYLEHNFFDDFSNLLNLFRHLPKTPFIWHLSSGKHQGLEIYISIYKWNRDNLFRLKTVYISKRIEVLEYRQIQLKDSDTAQAQSEKETIRLQLQEIAEFTKKIEELIAEGYDPKLDDGVGKNIAPLQKKGLLRCDVLNAKQLDKYLKADW